MREIHSTAIVDPKAELGEDVKVGPFAIIHENTIIGDGTSIGPHAVIYPGARIGKNVKIHQSSSVAHIPQDLKFANEPTELFLGDNCTIHEFTTLHRGTKETGKTVIGKNVLMMAYSHVAHDCRVGDNCILANGVQLAGHVTIEDWVIIGGLTPVHQFSIVGKHAMVGGGFRVTQDVPPFIIAAGYPLKFNGVNLIGLRRRGFTADQIDKIKDAYRLLYNSGLNVKQAKDEIAKELANEPAVADILTFLDAASRGIIGK